MSLSDYIDAVSYVCPLILGFGIVLGFKYYKSLDAVNRLLLFYIIVSLAFDLLSRIIGEINGNNLILWPLLGLMELLIFSKLYLKLIQGKKRVLTLLAAIGAVYMLAEIAFIDSGNQTSFQPYSKVVASFLIVLMVCIYFLQQIKQEQKIVKPHLYLNFAILIFFALNLVLLVPLNFLINQASDLTFYVLFIYMIVNLIFYTYLIYFIWKNGKNQKPSRYGL